jgi:hypothetical protein
MNPFSHSNLDYIRPLRTACTEHIRTELKAQYATGPGEYLSEKVPGPPPGLASVGKGSGPVFTDGGDADELRRDLARLRVALRGKSWVTSGGAPLLDRLAEALLHPVRMARAALPELKPKVTRVPASGRRRRPGGGRKRNEAKAILAAGVKQAMQGCGLPVGVWHRNGKGGASPLMQAIGACWWVATGEPAGRTQDLSKLVSKARRWEFR